MSDRYKEIRGSLSGFIITTAKTEMESKKEAKEQVQELDGNTNVYDKWVVFNKKYQELFKKGRTTEANSLKDKFEKENT